MRSIVALLLLSFISWIPVSAPTAYADTQQLVPVSTAQDTANKPQSKVWSYADTWWAVLPSATESPQGTWLWRLEENLTWSSVILLSSSIDARADVTLDGALAHIFLHDSSPELTSIEYDSGSTTYIPWSTRPTNTSLPLPSSETASIAIDSTGRLWIATESGTEVHAHYADSPYAAFSGPVVLATGIATDDISAIAALPSSAIGILWSNQNSKRFGFRIHFDSDSPSTWQSDEIPASQSADSGSANGMADDHLNVTVGTNGTLYAAVKTSYDDDNPIVNDTVIALLIRRPNGIWDDLYEVDTVGTRPIVVLNETTDLLHVIYTSSNGLNDIVFKETGASTINFSPRSLLMSGSRNNSTSTPQIWSDEVVVLASNGTSASGVLTDFQPCGAGPANICGHWRCDAIPGGTLRDSSGYGNHGAINGQAVVVPGYHNRAISIDGDDYVVVPARRGTISQVFCST